MDIVAADPVDGFRDSVRIASEAYWSWFPIGRHHISSNM